VPCSLVDAPTGKIIDHNPDLILTNKNSLTHLPVLRLKGGADEHTFEETLQSKKRKTDELSPELITLSKNVNFAEINENINACRAISDEMVTVGKVARKWRDQIVHLLDEILITSRKVAVDSATAIGQALARSENITYIMRNNGNLNIELGTLREKLRQANLERDTAREEARTLRLANLHVPPVQYDQVNEDCVMIVSPSSKKYSDKVKSSPRPNKENFPKLRTPKSKMAKKPNDVTKATPSIAKKSTKAKSDAKAGPRIEVTTDDNDWKAIRKSIEQKVRNPKVRSIRSKTGLILFPEDDETTMALRRTPNLKEIPARRPRIIIRNVDSLLEIDEIPWAIVNKNTSLNLGEADIGNIKPLFKMGPIGTNTWYIG